MASRKCFSLPVSCLLVLVLSACATLSKNECLNADWYHLGTQDGAAGYPQGRLLEHYEACAEYGIRPDDTKYLTGRSDGLVTYCQPANAIREANKLEVIEQDPKLREIYSGIVEKMVIKYC